MTAEQAKRLENIPDALKQCARWMCWKAEPNPKGGHARKAPRSPKTGQIASKTDPAARGTFAEAATACAMYGLDGVGFVFEAGCGFVAVDLDDIGDRMNRDEAQRIVNTLQSYTESSYSGRGAHIICAGSIPDNFNLSQAQGLEMYGGRSRSGSSGAAFLALTGNRLNGYELRDSSAELAQLHADYSRRAADQRGSSVRTEAQQQPAATTSGSRLTDSEILAKAMQSAEFAALWAGDLTSAGGDHSSADYSLAGKLMFWTGRDIEQADRLFRQSGLMRDKWDRPTSGSTYGRITLERAAATCATVYGDRRPADRATAEAAAMPAGDQSGGSSMPAALPTAQQMRPDSIAAYMDGGQFGAELTAYSSRKSTPTGFAELDRRTAGGLYPGLYVIGGLPGAGKTTFCAQLADQISAAGRDVLFFSLEMSRLEMISKSLARLCAQKHGTADALTALAIRCGQGAGLVREAAAEYRRTAAGRLSIIESEATTAAGICDYVRAYIAAGNPAPVVIIDYLQLLAAGETSKQTAKEATDKAMRELKLLSRRAQITVIAISSLNRDNYTKSLALDALKESGGVEYSADVVAGLQFRIMRSKPTAQQIETAKTQNPRELELKIIKNRFGQLFGAELDYFPHCDLFREPAAATAAAELAADQSGDQTSSKGGGDTWTATATG